MTAISNPRRRGAFGDERPALRSWSGFVRWIGRFTALAVGTLAGVIALALVTQSLGTAVYRSASQAASFDLSLPTVADFTQLAERSVVYSSDGRRLAVLHDAVNRVEIGLDGLPEHVWQAVLAAEDRRFFDHEGYDVEGISRAALANLRAGGIAQGGSTITQQLAKVAVGDDLTYERKLEEVLYAMALERRYDKEQLLERYLNEVYFGAGAYGIAAAAEEFFHTSADQLRVEQAALLAGQIRAPSRLDARTNPEAAELRRNAVLDGMAAEGYLEPEAAAIMKARPLGVEPPRPAQIREPYIVEAVKQEFFANPAFGETRDERIAYLFSGGLEIYTTIDPDLQRLAEQAVEEHFPERDGVTASIASVDPRNGRVLAAAFGRDFDTEQFNLALQGRRQPGSAFKPFVMAAALDQGYPLSLTLEGRSGTTFGEERVTGTWAVEGVRNYGDQSFQRLAMTDALVRSVNTAFAQLVTMVGPDAVVELTDRLGISQRAYGDVRNYSIALGGLHRGVSPVEMASAYGAFAFAGQHATPHVIERVVDHRGEEIYRADGDPVQALRPEVNAAMVDALKAVVQRGTGTAARLPGWEVGGKTGTTQRNRDVWFVGFTPVLSTAVWVGNPDDDQVLHGMSSASTAAPLWRAFMQAALADVEPVPFPDGDVDDTIVRTGEPVDVPDVRGLAEAEAVRTVVEARLVPVIRLSASGAPRGTVIWQSPGGGQRASVGDSVQIGVSTGVPPPPPPPPSPEPTEEPEAAPDEGADDGAGPEDAGSGEGDGGSGESPEPGAGEDAGDGGTSGAEAGG
jgi:penicillin-binding protein 1A